MPLSIAFLLGLVEGISEFLPISSTAHLILTSRLLGLPQTEFLKSFEIAIQMGAILSVMVLYFRPRYFTGAMIIRLVVAFIPTVIVGFLLHSVIRNVFFESEWIILGSLFFGGIALILFERWHTEGDIDDISHITLTQAAIIGLFQSIAVIPGVSRSAATIIGGLLLGVRRKAIVDFSFLLAIPTMAAATAFDLQKTAIIFSSDEVKFLLVGFVVAFVSALLSVVWLLRFIRGHSFASFGVYRTVLAVVFGVLLLSGVLK